MSEEENTNIRSVRLMESFVTYECHGDIKLNLDLFPDLKGKTDQEIQEWLNDNYCDLYVDTWSHELRKDNKIVYDEEELEYYKENPDEKPESDIADDVIELSEYWSNTEVVWDKIKCEEKNMFLQ